MKNVLQNELGINIRSRPISIPSIHKLGRDKMFAYKMNPHTMVVNIASSCCHTFLLVRNPEYDKSCVTTSDDFPVFDDGMEPIGILK